MKKNIFKVLKLAVILGALFALGWAKEASAEEHVNVDIAILHPLQFAAPPDVYVVPSGRSYVYMVADYDGVYFYGGNWYRFYNGYWYRSSRYNERWDYIETSIVPQVIIVLPPEYIHYVPSDYHRIHYDDFHSNWRTWDQRRHWDNYDWYQHERNEDIRRERYNHIERDRQQRGVQQPQQQGVQQQQQRGIQTPKHPQGQQREVQQPQQQQRDVQQPQRQQREVQQPQQQREQVQQPQHQQEQKQQKHEAQQPQRQQGQERQQHDSQKPQQQQGEKEHGGNKLGAREHVKEYNLTRNKLELTSSNL